MIRIPSSLLAAVIAASPAVADPAIVEDATATQSGSTWTFSVTLSHPDTGWDDYADGWEVLATDGTRLGFRELLHPHVNEQPFTRSLSGVTIPEGTTTVLIRARTNVDGWGEATYELTLSGS
ncbi:MAG: hypothetical protein AAF748_00645 [Pseudomonadota bacterium]